MELESMKWILIRSAIFLGLFVLLHYLFDFFPNIIISMISGTDESLYQHLKIAFYAYILLALIEIIIFRNEIEDLGSMIYYYMLSAFLIPWFITVLWFIGPAFYGRFENLIVDVVYANIITYISLFSLSILERGYRKMELDKALKIVIICLFVLSIVEFSIFTFRLPWHDLFLEPTE